MPPRDQRAIERALGREFVAVADYILALEATEPDALKKQKLAGFLVLTATTAIEVRVREFLEDFAASHHALFAAYVSATMEKTNARVKQSDLMEYAGRFGKSAQAGFKRRLKRMDPLGLRATGTSIRASYDNLLTWRNNFAHEGKVSCTFDEARRSIRCACAIVQLFEYSVRNP